MTVGTGLAANQVARKSTMASIKANADRQAANVLPIIQAVQKTGRARSESWPMPSTSEEYPQPVAENGMQHRFETPYHERHDSRPLDRPIMALKLIE